MTKHLHELSSSDLRTLATALKAARLRMPVTEAGLSSYGIAHADKLVAEFAALQACDFNGFQTAMLLESIVEARSRTPRIEELIDVVASGPDLPGIMNRDTSVVVQQLFSEARQSVLVVGYSVYQGDHVFATLAKQMSQLPELQVTLCLNVGRDSADARSAYQIRHHYFERFKSTQWPAGYPIPTIYFDPRSIDDNPSERASLHAKCIVVDRQISFVSSANFTARGQKHNIEIGLRIECPSIANCIHDYFLNLVDEGILQKLV